MTETIHVELVGPCDAADFLEFLAGRGLSATVTSENDHCEMEVGYAVDPEARLRRDFDAALASWLETSGRPLIPVLAHGHDYVLRPPGD